MKMWSGRFSGQADARFEQWQRSFPFDCRLVNEELAASRAHARALRGAGVLTGSELEKILRGLEEIGLRACQPGGLEDEKAEDIHHFVEQRLVGLIGETGLKLHTGRSRNEQIATDLRLYTRSRIDELQESISGCIDTLLERAVDAGDAIMPAYTHLQPAEPVLVAHWLLAYAEMLFRDSSRLADCRRRVDVCPLGSGAIAGATLPLDRHAMAAELGFAAITANSLDATSDRDFVVEFLQVLSLIAVHLSRWAEELIIFATSEFRFVDLPELFSTGSSAMPQKKNPDALELIRAKAAGVIADSTAVLVLLKGLPLAYNKDLQETQQRLFSAAATVNETLHIATGFLAAVKFDHLRMKAAASKGFLNATAAAQYLAHRGVPFRRAHELVGQAVRLCLERGCELDDLTPDELSTLAPEFDKGFYGAITRDAVLAGHDVPGGTAPAQVRRALADARDRLAHLREGTYARA